MLYLGGSGSEYPRAILSTLLYVLQQKSQSTLDDTKAYYNRLVPPLLTKTIVPLVENGHGVSAVLADDSVLDVTGRLIRIITHALDKEHQDMIVSNIFQLFVNNKPSNIITEKAELVADRFRPLDKDASLQAAGCTVVMASVLAAVQRDIPLPIKPLPNFIRQIAELAEAPKSPAHRLALLRIIGLVVNKWIKEPIDMEQVKQLTQSLLTSITTNPSDESASEKLRIVFWITKALLLRTEKFGMETTLAFVSLLAHPVFGTTASRGFSVLLDEDEFLNKLNHAVVRMLYKQRTFAQCVPLLVEGFKAADSSTYYPPLHASSNNDLTKQYRRET